MFFRNNFWKRDTSFSTFSKNNERRFKDSDIFEKIFVNIVNQAIKYNLIDGTTFYTDSTHKKANANKNKYEDELMKIIKVNIKDNESEYYHKDNKENKIIIKIKK